MRIRTNYDLLNSACLAKNGINLNETISKSFIKGITWAAPIAGIVTLTTNEKDMLSMFTMIGAAYAIYPLINILYQNLFKQECKDEFNKELQNIADQLNNLKVYTNKDLLQQANLIKKSYQLKKKEGEFPTLKEKKYIEVQTFNDGSKVLLQEHNIGDDTFHISVSNDKEIKQLVLKKQLT